ncbi:hypothetical protein COOONC_28445 [Cooperia oncophora]
MGPEPIGDCFNGEEDATVPTRQWRSLIQGTISALGYLENGVYYQEPDCYETIRDLIRFLRTDSKVLLARKICGERNIIENDLIPIIKSENPQGQHSISRIVGECLTQTRQIVSLKERQHQKIAMNGSLIGFWRKISDVAKLAFADVKFFTALKKRLEKYFIETRTVAESNSHDRVITAFLDSGIDKVLTNIATQSKEQEFHLSIMVIFALILKEHEALTPRATSAVEQLVSIKSFAQKPADIVSAGRGRTEAEKEQAEEELRQILEAEKAKLAAQRRKILSSRHSRFHGTYVVKGLSGVNKDKDLLVFKPINDVSDLSFQAERKNQKAIPKNRRPFNAELKTHLSSMDLRIKLKKFLEEDLLTCFNRLMKSTKEMVSSCLPVESFHHIQVHLDNYLESAATLQKEAKSYGLRAQHALSAYKELILFHLHLLDKGSKEEKDFAKRTCFHILTVEEYREMGFVLIRKYKPSFLSKTFLRELVLAIHYYFHLLERSVKAGQLTTVTKRSKIRRATARRKKTAADAFGPEPLPAVVDDMDAEDLEKKWTQITDEIKDIILGNVEPSADQFPVNTLLDVQEEQNQKFAMLKIQRALRECRAKDAMGLYRASRAMWPDDGIFGDPGNSADKQLEEIRDIFFTDLKEVADELLKAEKAAQKKFTADSMIDDGNEEDPYTSDEEEEARYETKEVKFDLEEYVAFYARTDVLRWYVFLLNDFDSNSVEVNMALLKLLHRVAFDLKMPVVSIAAGQCTPHSKDGDPSRCPMADARRSRIILRLFCRVSLLIMINRRKRDNELSLFRIFAEVNERLEGLTLEEMKRHPLFELYSFGYHLLKRFFLCYEKCGEKLAPEILFWKGPKECYEIENGSGLRVSEEESKNQKDAYSWSEELENELRSLYNEYRDMDERPEGMDVLDFIEPNLSRPRTRKQILKKMKEFALDPLGAKANKGSIMDRNFPIIRAKELIEQYNALPEKNEDMVDFIRTNLAETHGEFSRQKIIKQISYLGIVYEKKKPV